MEPPTRTTSWDRALVHLRVREHRLDRLERRAEQVRAQLLEAGTRDAGVEVDALEQRVDLDGRLRGRRQGALGAHARRAQAAEGALVLREVLLELALELLDEVVDHAVVEVLATEVRVTGRRLDLEDAAVDRQKRDIERTAAEIEDEHVALLLVRDLVQAVRDGGGRGLVDDAEHLEAGDGPGVLRRLALRVVEVGRDGDDGLLDLLAEVRLGDLLHLREDHRADLLRRERLGDALVVGLDHGLVVALRLDLERPVFHVALHDGVRDLAADEALGVEHRVGRVHRHLVLRGVADQALRVGEGDVRRRGVVALVIRDDDHALVLPHTDAGVRRTEVDTDSTLVHCGCW